jgi:hypothetical protein
MQRQLRERGEDGLVRETFTLRRLQARFRAEEFYRKFPKAAYMSGVETWRELPDDFIEFTTARLRSAD